MVEDPLDDLLVKKQDLDRKLLAEVLTPYIKLDQDSGTVIPTPAFARLTNSAKILVFLLGRKAAKSLNLLAETEERTPKEIATLTGINYNSVKPMLSSLHKARKVQKAGDSYSVPDHAILTIREDLKKTNHLEEPK
jgi:DNA-binding MarR family transcriptional regulator